MLWSSLCNPEAIRWEASKTILCTLCTGTPLLKYTVWMEEQKWACLFKKLNRIDRKVFFLNFTRFHREISELLHGWKWSLGEAIERRVSEKRSGKDFWESKTSVQVTAADSPPESSSEPPLESPSEPPPESQIHWVHKRRIHWTATASTKDSLAERMRMNRLAGIEQRLGDFKPRAI